jgi:hypothetical protein
MEVLFDKYKIGIENNIVLKNMSTQGFSFATEAMIIMGMASLCVTQQDEISLNNRKEINKLHTFAKLDPNWDSYGAEKITASVIQDSIKFIKLIDKLDQDVYFTAPGPNGEISIELINGKKSTELLIYPNKNYKYVCFEGAQVKDQGVLTDKKVEELILWINA